jgi:uncharacterized protein (DUF1697 family)
VRGRRDGCSIAAAESPHNLRVPTHVAFLRAINLGRHRRASADALRTVFEGLGFEEVATFRASGNVLFGSREGERRLVPAIEQELARALGFEVLVFLRSADELRALVRLATASDDVDQTGRQVRRQVAFLRARPPAQARERVLALATEDDGLAFSARELLWSSHGTGPNSRLNLRAIEKLIGPWTMRTVETVEQITLRYFA